MADKRLILADPLSDEGMEILTTAGGLVVEDFSGRSRGELLEGLPGTAGLIVRSATQADAELLERAGTLEVIGRAGVGLDNIDLAEATRRGIAIINAPAGNTVSTAEHAFALLLSIARGIPAAGASMRAGAWERKAFNGAQVAGKVLGVVGAGRIGTEVVRRARAFGMHVLVTDPFLSSARADSLSVEAVTLDELLTRADFVTLHVPLTAETRYLIGADEIARMKPTASLINAARGGIVDEAALVAALEMRAIAGAALDVFEIEPLPADHPLLSCPNLVMTPHIGASTPEAQREVAIEIARAVRDALLNGDLAPAVNLPSVAPEDRPATEALLDLARRLGMLLGGLTNGATDQLSVRCTVGAGSVQELVVSAAVAGLLAHRLAGPLNLINALVIAEERGIEISRATVPAAGRGRDWIEVSTGQGDERRSVAGKVTSVGEARLLRVDAHRVEVTPSGTLLFVGNDDVPGVIGALGTQLAAAGVNIGEFHQSRDRPSGQALGVASLDGELPAERLAAVRDIPGVHFLRQVRLPD
ncbi:MAG: phosphoglycerate dehydrogenase [Gemmatimonadota bacterium]